MLITSLLLAAVDDARSALDRYAALLRKTPVMSVDIQVQIENMPDIGRGQFVISKPDKLQLKVDWGEHSYEFVANSGRRIEIDHYYKQYFEFWQTGMMLPPGEVSMTPTYAFPSCFVTGDLRHLAPAEAKFRADRKIVQGSSVLTPIWTSYSLPDGSYKITAMVDQAGKLASLKTEITGDGPKKSWTISFSNYRLGSASSAFKVTPPRGYSPDRLPGALGYLESGNTFPAKDWRNTSSNASLSQMRGSAMLAVFVRPNCEPSKRAMKELATISAGLAKSGIKTVLLVDGGKSAAQGFAAKYPKYYAASANALKELLIPGSPTFFLVGKNGKLSRLWFGFDPDNPKQYSADIIAAAKGVR